MIYCGFLGSVEFYVMATIAAAMIVAYSVRPVNRSAVRTWLLPGILDFDGVEAGEPQAIDIFCRADGSVVLRRLGLNDIAPDGGAVSFAISLKGLDISIVERLTPGNAMPEPCEAYVTLDFLANEHYHLTYRNETTGALVATTLHNREGIHIRRNLIL